MSLSLAKWVFLSNEESTLRSDASKECLRRFKRKKKICQQVEKKWKTMRDKFLFSENKLNLCLNKFKFILVISNLIRVRSVKPKILRTELLEVEVLLDFKNRVLCNKLIKLFWSVSCFKCFKLRKCGVRKSIFKTP